VKLNWREKLAVCLLLVIGIFYLLLLIISISSGVSERNSSSQEDKIIVSKSEMLSNIRAVISFITCSLAAILLLKKQRLGWILGVPMMLIFIIIVTGLLIQAVSAEENFASGVLGSGLILLLLSFISLQSSASRKKFMVSRNSYLLTIGFSVLLGIIYFI